MPEDQTGSIDKLLEKYQTMFTPEKEEERSTLAVQIKKAFEYSIDDFLIGKHGFIEKDGKKIPKKFSIKDEKEARELFNYVGNRLVPYMFQGMSDEKLKVLREAFSSNEDAMEGVITNVLGLKKGEFLQEILTHKKNIGLCKELPDMQLNVGSALAYKDVRKLERDLYTFDNYDYLKRHLAQKISEDSRGKYGIETEKLKGLEDLGQIMRAVYSGKLSDQLVEGSEGVLYKSKLIKTPYDK